MPTFQEYTIEVAGLGVLTVIDPEGEPGYRVRLPDGQVTAFPAASGTPSEENAAADLAAALSDLGPRKAELRRRLAHRRWEVETAGVNLDGVVIATDDRSQAKLAGAVILANLEDQLVIDWKAATGWEQLGEDGVRALAVEIGRHVQRCFTRERELEEAIATADTAAELDAIALEIEAFALPPIT